MNMILIIHYITVKTHLYTYEIYVLKLYDSRCIVYVFYNIIHIPLYFFFFFFNDTAPTEFYPLPLPDALPICVRVDAGVHGGREGIAADRLSHHRLSGPCARCGHAARRRGRLRRTLRRRLWSGPRLSRPTLPHQIGRAHV